MPQIKNFSAKTSANDSDFLIMQSPAGETYKITKADLLAGLSSGGTGTGTGNTVNKTFVSDADTNGVFYYIGTNKNTRTWVNPYTANLIGIFYSSFLAGQGTIQSLVDRQPSYFHTGNEANPFIGFDLLANKSLILNYWSYRARSNSTLYIPERIILSGSNDGVTYVVISDKSFSVGQNNWVSFAVTGQTQAYRYFKFLYPTGANNFNAGEFEIYGQLTWN